MSSDMLDPFSAPKSNSPSSSIPRWSGQTQTKSKTAGVNRSSSARSKKTVGLLLVSEDHPQNIVIRDESGMIRAIPSHRMDNADKCSSLFGCRHRGPRFLGGEIPPARTQRVKPCHDDLSAERCRSKARRAEQVGTRATFRVWPVLIPGSTQVSGCACEVLA